MATLQISSAYHEALGFDPSIDWQMEPSEQMTLVALLSQLCPEVAIEIGSRDGGSMQVLSRFSKRLISLDVDPSCPARLAAKFPNVEFVTGRSDVTLIPLLQRLATEQSLLKLVLIDGDHSAEGVRRDIESLLTYRPVCPLFVVMHDSFNPAVREGIASAPWNDCPYVASLELDYVPGVITRGGEEDREMWGGFALAVMTPQPRQGSLQVSARMQHLFDAVYYHSVHWFFDPPTLARRCVGKVRRIFAGPNRAAA